DPSPEPGGPPRRAHPLLAGEHPTAHEEFTAVFLELKYFDHARLAYTFPAAEVAKVSALLAQDVDAFALLHGCRPEGAELPRDEESEPLPDLANDETSPGDAAALEQQAQDESARGNVARAAILLTAASHVAPMAQRDSLRRQAHAQAATLVERLFATLELPAEELPLWQKAIEALLEPASRGYWNREARLLYDLQRSAHSLEKPL